MGRAEWYSKAIGRPSHRPKILTHGIMDIYYSYLKDAASVHVKLQYMQHFINRIKHKELNESQRILVRENLEWFVPTMKTCREWLQETHATETDPDLSDDELATYLTMMD